MCWNRQPDNKDDDAKNLLFFVKMSGAIVSGFTGCFSGGGQAEAIVPSFFGRSTGTHMLHGTGIFTYTISTYAKM